MATLFGTLGFSPKKFLGAIPAVGARIEKALVYTAADTATDAKRSDAAFREVREVLAALDIRCEHRRFSSPWNFGEIARAFIQDLSKENPQNVVFNLTGTRMGATLSGSDGHFRVRLPLLGECRVFASRLGYANKISDTIEVGSTGEATIVLRLVPRPVSLDTINVVAGKGRTAAERRVPFLVDAGFYDRRRKGLGYFLTRSDIERRDPVVMSDVLRDIPGVRVVCKSSGVCSITLRAAATMFVGKVCWPSVVLDGVVLQAGGTQSTDHPGLYLDLDELLNPFDIEGVEVYPSPAGVPAVLTGRIIAAGPPAPPPLGGGRGNPPPP